MVCIRGGVGFVWPHPFVQVLIGDAIGLHGGAQRGMTGERSDPAPAFQASRRSAIGPRRRPAQASASGCHSAASRVLTRGAKTVWKASILGEDPPPAPNPVPPGQPDGGGVPRVGAGEHQVHHRCQGVADVAADGIVHGRSPSRPAADCTTSRPLGPPNRDWSRWKRAGMATALPDTGLALGRPNLSLRRTVARGGQERRLRLGGPGAAEADLRLASGATYRCTPRRPGRHVAPVEGLLV
jgi:hypothetical protein